MNQQKTSDAIDHRLTDFELVVIWLIALALALREDLLRLYFS
jgi:hypothetical protein